MEEETDEFEEILKRHRKEKKELQAKLQALKKSASKGDKKRKKEITEEMVSLEAETGTRQEKELAEYKSKTNSQQPPPDTDETVSEPLDNLTLTESVGGQPARVSKAQKRRAKKENLLKERELRILEQEEANLHGERHNETEQIKRLLKKRDLMIREIPSDGNCLYNAILYRLKELDGKSPTLTELRHETANVLRQNKHDYLPYVSHPQTGETLDESQYEEYCNDVAETTAWGGEVELRALSHVLRRPIEVVQAKGPLVTAGEEYRRGGPSSVTLTYHRHMYGLGEHYNSVTPYKEESEDEFS